VSDFNSSIASQVYFISFKSGKPQKRAVAFSNSPRLPIWQQGADAVIAQKDRWLVTVVSFKTKKQRKKERLKKYIK